jgi:hypothetical protein
MTQLSSIIEERLAIEVDIEEGEEMIMQTIEWGRTTLMGIEGEEMKAEDTIEGTMVAIDIQQATTRVVTLRDLTRIKQPDIKLRIDTGKKI